LRRYIRRTSAELFFLPTYGPDLDVIEQAFAKLKTLLRQAAERSVEATWKRIGALLACVSLPKRTPIIFSMQDMLQRQNNHALNQSLVEWRTGFIVATANPYVVFGDAAPDAATRGRGRPPSASTTTTTISSGRGAPGTETVMVSI